MPASLSIFFMFQDFTLLSFCFLYAALYGVLFSVLTIYVSQNRYKNVLFMDAYAGAGTCCKIISTISSLLFSLKVLFELLISR